MAELNLSFPGIAATIDPEALLIRSEKRLQTLSCGVVGGGWANVRYFLNRHVDKNYNHPDPELDLQEFAHRRGIDEPFVGLMTAAYVEKAQSTALQDGDLRVSAVVTLGLGNATRAGVSLPYRPGPGTINILLLIDAQLTPGAMVNAVLPATEAKTAALLERGILTSKDEAATGTSTDSIVIACSGRGAALPYAGTATPVGWLVGAGVRQSIHALLDDYLIERDCYGMVKPEFLDEAGFSQ